MIELAWLSLTDEFSRDVLVPVASIRRVRKDPDGSGAILTLEDNNELEVSESASTIASDVAALWGAALAAGV